MRKNKINTIIHKVKQHLHQPTAEVDVDLLVQNPDTELFEESNEAEQQFLVDNAFPDDCAKLGMDEYFTLPSSLRMLVGLAETHTCIGQEDHIPTKPNRFKYGGYCQPTI
jgi:hypothetical protein